MIRIKMRDSRGVTIETVVVVIVVVCFAAPVVDCYSEENDSFQTGSIYRYPHTIHQPAKITIVPSDQSVVHGGIVSFFCEAEGSPRPRIQWTKNGVVVSAGDKVKVQGAELRSVLRLESVEHGGDDGVVECMASNDYGKDSYKAKLFVYEPDRAPVGYPRIEVAPEMKSVDRGKNVVMQCSAVGVQPIKHLWIKNLFPVNTSDERIHSMPSGALEINNAQPHDEGSYECIAENNYGVAYSRVASLFVKVRRTPPMVIVDPESAEVNPGASINLTCSGQGSPMPNVKWFHGDREMEAQADDEGFHRQRQQHQQQEQQHQKRLVLQLERILRPGVFRCVGTSEIGKVEKNVSVDLKVCRHLSWKKRFRRDSDVDVEDHSK